MGFLNGLLLFGLLGSLVPLVIHLLERRKVPRLEFPSLRFLLALNQRQMRRLNLRRILLLLIRMVLIALIAFALARPTLLGPMARLFPEDAPRAVALAIDNSASMALETERGTLRDLALEQANEILAGLDEKDEVLLYALEEESFDLGGGPLPPSLARRLLSEWNPGEGTSRLRQSLAEIVPALRKMPQRQQEIYLLSDFAGPACDLDSEADSLPRIDDLRLFALALSEEPPMNAGLADLRLPVRPVLPGRPFDLGVAASLQTGETVAPFPVELELGGLHRGSLQLAPSAGATAWRSLSVSLEEEGPVEGVWRKKRDRFPLDDELPFSLRLAERLDVLLLRSPTETATGERLGLSEHLARALDPYRGTRADAVSLRLTVRDLQRLASADLEGQHLVVLAGGGGLSETPAQLLADYVDEGGGLIICPDAAGLGDLARHLLRRVDGPRVLEPVEGGSDYLAEFSPEHPIFRDFDEEHRRVLGEQPLWRIFRTQAGDREAPARLGSGLPALLAWGHGEGRVRLLLFEAGPEGGELPYSSMFLPLIQEMSQESAGAPQAHWAVVGQSLSWPLSSAEAADANLQVLAPGDRVLPVRVDASRYPPRAVLDRADRSGFYRLQARRPTGLEDLDLSAVRVPVAEGRLAPLPADSLERALAWPGLAVISPGEDLGEALRGGRFGKEIARPLLILAALLMALELWVAQRERIGA